MNKIKTAVEKLSADYVAIKTKTAFKRIHRITLHETTGSFKANIPYLCWCTDINQENIKIRKIEGGKTAEISRTNANITNVASPEINGLRYKEKKINNIYHYLPI